MRVFSLTSESYFFCAVTSGTFTAFEIERVTGTRYADKIKGSNASDVMYGGAGDDRIEGGLDDDTIAGDEGNDRISIAQRGTDRVSCGEGADIVFAIVTDSKAVKSVALGPDGIISGLKKGGIFIDMSTIEPDASREVAAEFNKAGLFMLDGPLSGSPVTVIVR